MGLPFLGGDDSGGSIEGGKGIYTEEAEYGRSVHCNATDSRPLLGGSAVARDTGLKKVVGKGRVGIGGGM